MCLVRTVYAEDGDTRPQGRRLQSVLAQSPDTECTQEQPCPGLSEGTAPGSNASWEGTEEADHFVIAS